MKTQYKILAGVLAIGFSSLASAQSFYQFYDSLSGLHNLGNFYYSEDRFFMSMDLQSGEGPVFINGANYDFTNWDSNLGFDTDFEALNGMSFGDSYNGAQYVEFNTGFHVGEINNSVLNGDYSFDFQLVGGADANALDVLAEFTFNLTVIDGLDVSGTGTWEANPINEGDTATLDGVVTNDSSEDFLVNGLYAASGTNSVYPYFSGFDYSMIGQTAAANGGTASGVHSHYVPTVAGTYSVNSGVYGGLYSGDSHWLELQTGDLTVNPVPEPFSLIGLGSLALLGLKRRKRA